MRIAGKTYRISQSSFGNCLTGSPLQLAHGADPTLKNQEGQNPLELATADDVKCLLQEAMPTSLSVLPTTNKASAAPLAVLPRPPASPVPGASAGNLTAGSFKSSLIIWSFLLADMVTGAAATSFPVVPSSAGIGVGFPLPHPGDGSMDFSKTEMVTPETSLNMSMGAFLASLGLETLREIFDREHINVEILADMGHEDLKQIGITAFGHRHKLIKGLEKLVSGNGNLTICLTYSIA